MSLPQISSPPTLPIEPGVQLVSKSMFDQLLHKFPESEHVGFDYKQSALWSPLIKRNAFLSSLGKVITDHGILEKAGSITDEECCKQHEDVLWNFGAFPRNRQYTAFYQI
ncbi:hypothetical protein EUGRSUZ_D00467 [Eucalyptus grandis]|uniref:Uncharacterized protein n=2 Tax=Eucalyptus grandis TaxID=71139 RepID=A0ACC3L347_EUCGR|nr:hypothetical protein EUGRSUZ_D00467 [Eucalyptus grandis]